MVGSTCQSCVSLIPGCLSCSASTICDTCDANFNLNNDQCTIETNYTCNISCQTNYSCYHPIGGPSTCSLNQPIAFTLINTEKALSSNAIILSFQLNPVVPDLNNIDFSQAISSNISGVNYVYSYNGNGLLIVTAEYDSSLQGQNISLTLSPQNGNNPVFALTSTSSVSFVVDPNNNIAA
jgi:hypothetical protein